MSSAANMGFASVFPGELTEWQFESQVAGDHEVVVDVTHCGVGRGDVDFADRRFNNYPFLVPGHEIVGLVAQVGAAVTHIKVGDRVGVGYQVSSCGSCSYCLNGEEQHCRSQECLVVDRVGGFAPQVRADARFAIPLPESLAGEMAAPLICAGLTAYSAVKRVGVQPGSEVAVVGLGGMGQVATQLANWWGASVTAVTSKDLEPQVLSKLGVASTTSLHEFRDEVPVDRFDRVIIATSMLTDIDPFLRALNATGNLLMLGSPTNAIYFSIGKINDISSRTISGSSVGSMNELSELLALAVDGHIHVGTRLMSMGEAPKALSLVRENDTGARVVLTR